MRLRENDCVMMDGCLTICVFPRFLRIAHSHWHVLIFYPSNAMCLFNRAIEKSLVWLPHCATGHTHTSISRSPQIRIQRSILGWWREKDVQHFVVNKLPTTLNMKIDLRMRFTETSVINLVL